MPDITVQRHGDRWAIVEPGVASPTKEFETRDAAESAARALAGDGRVDVREDDPMGLADAQGHGAGEPEGTPAGGPTGVSGRERARSNQAGL
ncbi:DUF2188 domain-containing protein [Solirubrobacter sp. CPCC 204708]|uniref:DUF2188 domain-containing protein n=1 Tax=Solirubrobacter deserti TaxID=2282478 RepID=A0ABT4RMU3_9ACTN|nr:DUF2188 domain-containing protein [Solirubrobacter deserti]MBE2320114.1 DUF2188 domain-containing protein [Solirubrobacter deserti]MDA0139832.1 DUF2188 domain-containing protein [Solirubrobacter deserti]